MAIRCMDCIGFFFCNNVQTLCNIQDRPNEYFKPLHPKIEGYLNRTKQLVSMQWSDTAICDFLLNHYNKTFKNHQDCYTFIHDVKCGKYNGLHGNKPKI
jgi:hypothetical protein